MATVKATNPVTGKTFDVSAEDYSSQYKPLGWTMGAAAPVAENAATPAASVVPGATGGSPEAPTATPEAPTVEKPTEAATAAPSVTATPETAVTIPEVKPKTAPVLNEKQTSEIDNLVKSGKVFNETDAQNYAFAKGEANWQQYVNSVGGKTNPLYIGTTNWGKLQKQYTPYQLEQATIRTKNGIYWNQEKNIGEIPAVDPSTQINADTKKISSIVTDAKASADKTLTEEAKKTKKEPSIADTAAENQSTIMTMLKDQYGGNAEKIYTELYNTDEMKSAQSEAIKYKTKNDEYDQQLEDLKDDIRKEVEGEAPESYINALATVRGDKILKLKRANQRDLDAANAVVTNLKENASNLLQVRVKDADTRYNQLFQTLQLQIQQEGTAFNQEVALANIQMNLPENRSITIGGTTYKGLKENDNLNVVQFTEAGGKTYVIGVDKATGKQMYKQYIGTAREPSSGSGSAWSAVKELAEYNATQELARTKEMAAKLSSGDVAIDYDEKGNSFYYDKKAYDADYREATTGWNAFLKPNPDILDYRL